VALAALLVLGLAIGSFYLLFSPGVRLRHGLGGQALGFAGAWFFAIIAPTSLIPGMSQTLAEHRMYLALIPLVMVAVWSVKDVGLGWAVQLGLVSIVALALGLATIQRNRVYLSTLSLWSDTVAKRPANARAHTNLGNALFERGRIAEAMAQFQNAVGIDPASPEAHNGLGHAEAAFGRLNAAEVELAQAVQNRPNYAEAHSNLGSVLFRLGERDRALAELEIALRLKPDYADAHYNLGLALAYAGRMPEAVVQFREAVRLAPNDPDARHNLGAALRALGRNSAP
jgi:tetratricopeptide (TPR) repeat protein